MRRLARPPGREREFVPVARVEMVSASDLSDALRMLRELVAELARPPRVGRRQRPADWETESAGSVRFRRLPPTPPRRRVGPLVGKRLKADGGRPATVLAHDHRRKRVDLGGPSRRITRWRSTRATPTPANHAAAIKSAPIPATTGCQPHRTSDASSQPPDTVHIHQPNAPRAPATIVHRQRLGTMSVIARLAPNNRRRD